MHPFATFLKEHDVWLMRRVRDYALERGYTRYTSTLEEAWRISIVGLTDSIAAALEVSDAPWELDPDDSFVADPIAALVCWRPANIVHVVLRSVCSPV